MTVTCDNCNKNFKYPCLLTKHFKSKTACVKNLLCNSITVENTCPKCSKKFTRKSNLFRHLKLVDCTKKKLIYPANPKIEYIKNMVHGNNNTINVDQSTNINIHLGSNVVLPFDALNYDYVMKHIFTKEVMFELLKAGAMPAMCFRMMHLNPEFPKGHSVIPKNKRDNTYNIKGKDGWKVKHFDEFIRDYFSNIQYIIDIFKEENISDKMFTSFIKEKIDKLDNKFCYFFDDDRILDDTKNWIKMIKKELINAETMLRNTKRKDTRKLGGKKDADDIDLLGDGSGVGKVADEGDIGEEEEKIKKYKEEYAKKMEIINTLADVHNVKTI